VLVADPSYGATYDDLDAVFRTVRAGRSWCPPRLTGSPTATTGDEGIEVAGDIGVVPRQDS
jgi:hypothetical protein